MLTSFDPTYTICGLTVLAFFLLWRAALPKPIAGIPHNEAAAKSILGDVPALQKYHAQHGKILEWLTRQCLHLNAPVIQVFLKPLGPPAVVVSDARETQDILVRRSHEFDRSKFAGDVFAASVPAHHIRLPTNKQWTLQRRLLGSAIGPNFIRNAVGPKTEASAKNLIDLLDRKAQMAQGRPFDAMADCSFAIFDTVWTLMTGLSPGTLARQRQELQLVQSSDSEDTTADTDDVDTAIQFLDVEPPEAYNAITFVNKAAETAALSPMPKLQLLANKFSPAFRKAKALQERAVRLGIDTALQSRDASSENASSMIDSVVRKENELAMSDGREPDFYTEVIRDEILGNMYAGWNTAATTLGWFLKYMTEHQQVQETLRDALYDVLNTTGRTVDELDAKTILKTNIPYLDAVIEETLRHAAPVAAHMRVAAVDTEILGHRIPKGTDVFMATLTSDMTHPSIAPSMDETRRSESSRNNKSKWRPWDAAAIGQFEPTRWLKHDAEKGGDVFDAQAGPSLPFGGGPRGCPGKQFALAELRVCIATIMLNLRFDPVPADLGTFEAHGCFMRTPNAVYVRPVLLGARASKRDSMMML